MSPRSVPSSGSLADDRQARHPCGQRLQQHVEALVVHQSPDVQHARLGQPRERPAHRAGRIERRGPEAVARDPVGNHLDPATPTHGGGVLGQRRRGDDDTQSARRYSARCTRP